MNAVWFHRVRRHTELLAHTIPLATKHRARDTTDLKLRSVI